MQVQTSPAALMQEHLLSLGIGKVAPIPEAENQAVVKDKKRKSQEDNSPGLEIAEVEYEKQAKASIIILMRTITPRRIEYRPGQR